MRNICASLMSSYDWKRPLAGILVSLLAIPSQAGDKAQQDLLVFPSVELFDNTGLDDERFDSAGYLGILSVLYTYSGNRLRFLAEYVLSTEESEVERLTAGWQFSEQATLWVGKFHQPSKYWTTEYHHGQYLQTSISRPGIEEWEHDSGPVTSHVTGLLLEIGQIRNDSSGFQFMASAGFAPILTEDSLEPWEPGSEQGAAFNFRLAFLPDYFDISQVGILGGWSDIEINGNPSASQLGIDSIEQLQLGTYLDWHWEQLRLIASINYLQHKHIGTDGSITNNFWSGYVQAEYEIGPYWTVYGRHESNAGERDTEFVQMIPKFVRQRNLIGIRWDITTNHALTLEIADTETTASDFGQFRLQWSAVIPR